MLEDACLLNDTLVLPSLFEVDAVLLARGTNQVRGRPAIANVIIDQLRDGGSYVAAPQLVLQSGPLALIISDAAISVARRNLAGLTLLGENRAQELEAKAAAWPDARWHFIGQLQSRKVKQILPLVELIHRLPSSSSRIPTDR